MRVKTEPPLFRLNNPAHACTAIVTAGSVAGSMSTTRNDRPSLGGGAVSARSSVTSGGDVDSASANAVFEESTIARANDTAINVCFVKVTIVVLPSCPDSDEVVLTFDVSSFLFSFGN